MSKALHSSILLIVLQLCPLHYSLRATDNIDYHFHSHIKSHILKSSAFADIIWITTDRVSTKHCIIRAKIKSDVEVSRVAIKVNGKNFSRPGIMKEDGFNIIVAQPCTLEDGENFVELTVVNNSGSFSEKKVIYSGNGDNRPKLTFISEPRSTQSAYHLRVGIKSNSKVSKIRVIVNGKTLRGHSVSDSIKNNDGNRGIIAVQNDGYDAMINEEFTLIEAQNLIEFYITNASGTTHYVKTVELTSTTDEVH